MKKLSLLLFSVTILFSVGLSNAFVPTHTHAAAEPYQLLVPLAPNYTSVGDSASQNNFATYMNEIFRIFFILIGILAVGMIVWGGLEYVVSASGFTKANGRKRIENAFWGLGIALTSWLILSTLGGGTGRYLNFDLSIPSALYQLPAQTSTDILTGNNAVVQTSVSRTAEANASLTATAGSADPQIITLRQTLQDALGKQAQLQSEVVKTTEILRQATEAKDKAIAADSLANRRATLAANQAWMDAGKQNIVASNNLIPATKAVKDATDALDKAMKAAEEAAKKSKTP